MWLTCCYKPIYRDQGRLTKCFFCLKPCCLWFWRILNRLFVHCSIKTMCDKNNQPRLLLLLINDSFSSTWLKSTFLCITLLLRSHSDLPKSFRYLFHWKPFKNDKKCFLYHLKSSFHSQDISFPLFCHVEKTAWIGWLGLIHDVTTWLTSNCNTHVAQYLKK